MVQELTRLLTIRRRLLRVLYVLTALLILVPPVLAAATGRAGFLGGLLLLPPLLAGYLIADALALLAWRRRVLRSWVSRGMNLGVMAGGLSSLPMLPSSAVGAMVRTLPILPPLVDEDLGSEERAVLAAFADLCWTERTLRALLPAALLAPPMAGAAISGLVGTSPGAAMLCAVVGSDLAVMLLYRFLPGIPQRRLRNALTKLSRDARARLAELGTRLDPHSIVTERWHRLAAAPGVG